MNTVSLVMISIFIGFSLVTISVLINNSEIKRKKKEKKK
jgi:hypothetical protein